MRTRTVCTLLQTRQDPIFSQYLPLIKKLSTLVKYRAEEHFSHEFDTLQ